jgi:glucokinase
MTQVLAVDLGGTNMRVAIVDDDGTILDRAHEPTPHDAATIDPFVDLVVDLRERHDVDHAVVGLPGRVDRDDGRLLHAPNLPDGWAAQVQREHLETVLGLPVALANDADVAAVGEAYFGAGREHRDVVYVTVSTGVGAGVLVGGRLVLPRYSGGEIGHTVVDRVAASRGAAATVEGLGSGTALARLASAAGLDCSGPELVRLVEAGDPRAVAVWDEAMLTVGLGVVNLVQMVAPTCIVVGGGVGRNGELVLAPIRAALAEHGPAGPPPTVVTALLGDDPGLIGAAAWRRATTSPTSGTPAGTDASA